MAFKSKVYIDATGDGDLAAWAGAPFKRGYGDDGAVQKSSLCFSFANVDSYDYMNGPVLYQWKNEKTPLYVAVRSGKYPLVDTHFAITCRDRMLSNVMPVIWMLIRQTHGPYHKL